MSFSSNELNLSGGSSTHLNVSYGVAGSAAASPGLNLSLGNRSVLKELHSNDSNNMVSKGISIFFFLQKQYFDSCQHRVFKIKIAKILLNACTSNKIPNFYCKVFKIIDKNTNLFTYH